MNASNNPRGLSGGRGSVRRVNVPRVLSSAGRAEEARSGVALPDGSFPIPSVEYLKKAITAHGRSSDPTAVRRHIIARAHALGAADLIPPHWST